MFSITESELCLDMPGIINSIAGTFCPDVPCTFSAFYLGIPTIHSNIIKFVFFLTRHSWYVADFFCMVVSKTFRSM